MTQMTDLIQVYKMSNIWDSFSFCCRQYHNAPLQLSNPYACACSEAKYTRAESAAAPWSPLAYPPTAHSSRAHRTRLM